VGTVTSASGDERDPALRIEGLAVSYPDRTGVLEGVDLVVALGERVGVVGPNGAGKTTLFLAVCGVLAAARGRLEVFGQAVRPGAFNPAVGLVFQNPDHQLFSATVGDDIAFGPRNLGLSEDEVAARVERATAATGVAALLGAAPHHLSGGEKRMVSIAAVLALAPRLLICDEPSANLDIRSRRRLIRFLERAPETQLIASHDLELILELCPRTILLDDGRVVADRSSRELMNDAALMEAHGLERPHSLVPHANPHHHHD
jgi:cobalt/nickel transport system ATP-binding protein